MFGVISIDKPAGMTSRDVVNRVQYLIKPEKAGHTGTLDPLATGVLLVAVGSATRLVEFSHQQSKTYEAEFQLGQSSNTLDVDGQVIELVDPSVPTRERLLSECAKWIGQLEQQPPQYSAINVRGKRSHQLARRGQVVELQPRKIVIHSIELLKYDYPTLSLRVQCGTGTYVRSLGSDIARGCGSDAVMSRLVRTSIGPFQLEACVHFDSLRTAEDVAANLRPPHDLLSTLPSLALDQVVCRRIRFGQPIRAADIFPSGVPQPDALALADRLVILDEEHELVAILCRSDVGYRSLRVFQNAMDTHHPSKSSMPHKPES